MPKKVQLKLLSTSGELLNVITCHGGQITVFRANSAADLRPYQRALSGTPGKERLSISVDGEEYNPEGHNLIGLGEPSPHSGMTIQEYFGGAGISVDNTSALLNSFGVARAPNAMCSSLTADEERRIRLLAATCEPDKVLILNEPFEHISSQWREQFAQLLTNFARQRSGLIVVTSLSFRPENWIDNDSIARTQVGETIQRTIGFGSAQSNSNTLMNQLRDAIRADEQNEQQTSSVQRPSLSAAISQHHQSDTPTQSNIPRPSHFTRLPPALGALQQKVVSLQRQNPSVAPTAFAVVGVLCAILSIFLITGKASSSKELVQTAMQRDEQPASKGANVAQTSGSNSAVVKEPQKNSAAALPPAAAPQVESSTDVVAPVVAVSDIALPKASGILVGYPDTIRAGLLETARGGGVPRLAAVSNATDNPRALQGDAVKKDSGNLFKLLESASSATGDKSSGDSSYPTQDDSPPPQSWQNNQESEQSEVDPSDEQQRREAIRQKFLEAIRAAAQKRQANEDDSGA